MGYITYTDDQANRLIDRIEEIVKYKVRDLGQLAAHFSDNAECHMEANGETEFEFQAHETKSGHVEIMTVRQNEITFDNLEAHGIVGGNGVGVYHGVVLG